MALYTYRQMPPTGPDNIAGAARPAGARFSSGHHRRAMKTIHFESTRYYHRLGFDARFKLKPIGTRMDPLISRGIQILPFLLSLSLSQFFFFFFGRNTRGTIRSHL